MNPAPVLILYALVLSLLTSGAVASAPVVAAAPPWWSVPSEDPRIMGRAVLDSDQTPRDPTCREETECRPRVVLAMPPPALRDTLRTGTAALRDGSDLLEHARGALSRLFARAARGLRLPGRAGRADGRGRVQLHDQHLRMAPSHNRLRAKSDPVIHGARSPP